MDPSRYQCPGCGHVYDERRGNPREGYPPGTRWAQIPEDFRCPDCGAAKSDFQMVEVA